MNVYIGEPVEVSDMQGPCPDGFHVPLISEWQAIYDIGVSLGAWSSSDGISFSTYLKIPMAGVRNYTDLSLNYRGSTGYCWSSTTFSVNNAYSLYISSSYIGSQSSSIRCYGIPVRGLKNSPTVPTTSWTKLYGTSIESGGIFHNTTDGLISLSSDGTTRYTLMDKNLGATTVYNYGDTLTEANCGKVYQRGNNYGFSGDANYDTSLISKSSTQVNVTGYGPGNYYESSTWITTRPRQSSANDGNNLRGGVSQGISTKSVEVKNIYIGEYGWKPLNPKCWYKFDGDYTDATGTYGVASGTSTFQTLSSGVKVLQTDGSNVVVFPSGVYSTALTTWTFAYWIKPIGSGYCAGNESSSTYYDVGSYVNTSGRNFFGIGGQDYANYNNAYSMDVTDSSIGSNWRLVIVKSNGTKVEMNINGTTVQTHTSSNTKVFRSGWAYCIGGRYPTSQTTSIQMSNFVISTSYWDDATCLDMYNKTKSNYGL